MVGRPLAQVQILDWAQKAVVLRQIDAQPTRGPAGRTWYGFDMAAEMSEDAETIANNHESVVDDPEEEVVMDLHNNVVGREIGRRVVTGDDAKQGVRTQ